MNKCVTAILLIFMISGLSACTNLFLQPYTGHIRTPTNLGLPYEDVFFDSQDGMKLHGWFLPANGSAVGTVVYFHGNAENISSHIGNVYWMPAEGFNVFLPDYRGYGVSEGVATIDGVHHDALAAMAYIRSRGDIDPDRLIIFGQSLGAAIAIHTIATENHHGIRAVIAESTFSEYRKIARYTLGASALTWPFQWPFSFTISNAYSPARVIDQLSPTPLLLVHGSDDKIVPITDARELYALAGEPKDLWIIEGARHIQAFSIDQGRYRSRLVEYMRQVLGEKNIKNVN